MKISVALSDTGRLKVTATGARFTIDVEVPTKRLGTDPKEAIMR